MEDGTELRRGGWGRAASATSQGGCYFLHSMDVLSLSHSVDEQLSRRKTVPQAGKSQRGEAPSLIITGYAMCG